MNFQPFGGGPYPGIVVESVLDDLVDNRFRVLGIVVTENQFLRVSRR